MVYHVLKDGSKVNSVNGIVIRKDQYPQIYKVINRIERGENNRVIQAPKGSS